MSVRRDFLLALRGLVSDAVPLLAVHGFEKDDAKPERPSEFGDVFSGPGVVEEIGYQLSPYARQVSHVARIEIVPPLNVADADLWLDSVLALIGDAVLTEGEGGLFNGLLEALECSVPDIEIESLDGTPSRRWAGFDVTAQYWVRDPLNA